MHYPSISKPAASSIPTNRHSVRFRLNRLKDMQYINISASKQITCIHHYLNEIQKYILNGYVYVYSKYEKTR